jgi:hypothetical protein
MYVLFAKYLIQVPTVSQRHLTVLKFNFKVHLSHHVRMPPIIL